MTKANWTALDGGGFALKNTGAEWASIELPGAEASSHKLLTNCVVQVTVSGNAAAAGISFGDYKDFLVPLDNGKGECLLQVEVDAQAGRWAFRADGRLIDRTWWNASVASVNDILAGDLVLKAHKAEEVTFRDLGVHRLDASCRLSVIMTCYRFAQRLRVSLHSWCRQAVPSGTIEVIVANPQSPDGTHESIAAMAAAYPEVRVRELTIDTGMARNKGFMLNRAIEASCGEWIWITDADCVFPSNCATKVLPQLDSTDSLYYGERRSLGRAATASLLSGRTNTGPELERLAESARATDSYPWGYTQIVHRSLTEKIRYGEGINNFSTSDGQFLEECRRRGTRFQRLEGLACFHLHHPFAWYGTELFL
jgi:hypothetical protein